MENNTKKTDKLIEKRNFENDVNSESASESRNDRKVHTNQYTINVNTKIQHAIEKEEFLSNKICTSKYNFINAIPKILCEQFSKVGNIYFLILAILQMVPAVSQSGGSPVMLIPLIFVTLVNGIKDFCEDYKRKQSDNRENKTKCSLIDPSGGVRIVNWEEIRPGDIVKVYKDEYFPSDLVLIYSKNKNGVAYVETKNLDGETNLKYKESVKNTYRMLKNIASESDREQIIKMTFGRINCDMPNANMYDFEGVYYFENRSSFMRSERTAVSPNESSPNLGGVENDDHNNTSSFNNMNLSYNYEKRLSVMEDENYRTNIDNSMIILDYNNVLLRGSSLRNTEYIYAIVIYCGHNSKIMLNSLNARTKQSKVFRIMNSQLKLIIILQMIICFSFAFLYSVNPNKLYQANQSDVANFRFIFSNFILSFLTWLIAICNIVPISLLVTIEMIKFCQAIFISWDAKMYDKENRRTAIVQSSGLNEELGQVHDIFTDKTGTLTKNIMQFKYMVIGEFLYGSDEHVDQEELKAKNITNVDFKDPSLFEHWNNKNHINSENISNFIFSLALCHSVIVERKNDKLEYNASSPDELALVNAAKFFGVEFIERTDDNSIKIKHNNRDYKFKLLHIFEFNSDRKRMSVVIRDQNNVIRLICKGADTVIRQRLDKQRSNNIEKIVTHYLEEFGKKGLRTLMLVDRVISEDEYKKFYKSYHNAFMSPVDKKQKLDKSYEILERDLILQGATAIEDCLQDDLKPTLQAFRQIGIKIWMLTGDHPFTAVSIAHSCGLIENSYSVKIISSPRYEEINKNLFEVIDEEAKDKVCLVITGDALSVIQKPSGIGLMNLFLIAIKKSVCVICSRVSPKQKAELVLLVKKQFPHKTTLAIGDGANDVNMINSADVGIGIMGNEGQQAARASDYVIGQFSFLRRLMFVHGREAYRKNSFAVGYILWKNFLYVAPVIFQGFNSYFSGQTLYDPILDTLYNILFTAYPIGWFSTFDKELNHDYLESNPHLYEIGMNNKYFNLYIFWRWYLYAATAGLIIYLFNGSVFDYALQGENSEIVDIWTIGSTMYTCIVFVVNLRILLATNTHNFFSAILFLFSISSYLCILYITDKLPPMQTFGQWDIIFKNKVFISTMVLVTVACMLFEYGWRSIQFIVEEYIIKYTKILPVQPKRLESTIKKIEIEDSMMMEKGYAVKIEDSINNNLKYKDFLDTESERENNEKSGSDNLFSSDSNGDQMIVSNLRRRYTGFAFAEDVANINIINERIKENFFDAKFRESNYLSNN